MERTRVSYCGDLAQFPFRELILSLEDQLETGALFVRQERVTRKVYFQGGKPLFVQSNISRDNLWRFLIESEQLSIDSFEEVAKKCREIGKRFDEIALVENVLTPDIYEKYDTERCQQLLLEMVQWNEGVFYYHFDEQLPQFIPYHPKPMEAKNIVIKGMLSGHDARKLRRYFRDQMDHIPVLTMVAEQIVSELPLNEKQRRLVFSIDGVKTIKRLVLGFNGETAEALNLLLLLESLRYVSDKMREVVPDSPKAQPTAALSDEAKSMIKRLQNSGDELLQKMPFEMLGIGRIFTEEELRKGYYTIAQNYHQKEMLDLLPQDLRILSYRIFEKASAFFEALVVWEKKRLSGEFNPFDELDQSIFLTREYPIPDAELSFLQGKKLYAEGQLEDALDEFANARMLEKEDIEYRAWHAALLIANFEDKRNETSRNALSELRRTVKDDPNSLTIMWLYAQTLESLDKREEAYNVYLDALALDPNNDELLAGKKRTRIPVTAKDLDAYESAQERDIDEEKRLKQILHIMEKSDYFNVFELPQSSSEAEIKKRYFALAKEYHPDRFKNTQLLETAEKIFILINEAYDVLTDKNRRRVYERSLRAMETQKSQKEMEKKISADRLVQKGIAYLQSNNWEQAKELFANAVAESKDTDSRFGLYLAWATFNLEYKNNPSIQRTTEEKFLEAASDVEIAIDARLLLGKMYRRLDQFNKAKIQFERVLDLDPHNVDALREIRLINQRVATSVKPTITQDSLPKETTTDKKGLLGSIFGRRKG